MDQTVDRRYADIYPELGTGPIPVSTCTSPEWHEKEREAIFKRCWINIGRVEELPNAGDYLVKKMSMWNASMLLVHGRDGKIRGFHNVCQHRGNLLVGDSESGSCRGFFTCKFHGWTYDDTGELRNITDEDNFFDPDKASLGLREIAVDAWCGFMFANLNPEQTLVEYLGPLATEKLASYPYDAYQTRYTYKASEQVNWKVLLDAQQEGYHVPFLHKRTISLSFPKSLVKFRSQDLMFYGPHRTLSTGSQAGEFEPTAVGGIASQIGATTIDAFAGASQSETVAECAEAMHGVFDFTVIFPNFVIGQLFGTYFTYNIWPQAVDQSVWEIRFYYSTPQNAGQAFSAEYGKVAFRDGLMEDASTHEQTQAGLSSGAIEHFTLQDEEAACRHGHKVVKQMVEEYFAEK